MNDIMKREDTSVRDLSRIGVNAVLQLAGGVVLAVLNVLPLPVFIAAGAVITVLGVTGVTSRDKADQKIGLVLTISGAAAILACVGAIPVLKAAGRTALFAGAAALIGLGIVNAFRFISGLKKRS
jgi:hypothetical protein